MLYTVVGIHFKQAFLKIITWNCNGALRNKFKHLLDFDADICVIQECENPLETKHTEYKNWAENHIWIGDTKNKGIGIFAKKGIELDKKNWTDVYRDLRVKHFLPCRVNNDFDLLAVWTHSNKSPTFGYIGQLWKYLQIHKPKLRKSLILGDFNSNVCWDKLDRWWNHSDVVKELEEIGIKSLYHHYWNEKQGEESQPTFFLHRKIEKPYHIDYIFGSLDFQNGIKKMGVGALEKWIVVSDHLPIVCEFKT